MSKSSDLVLGETKGEAQTCLSERGWCNVMKWAEWLKNRQCYENKVWCVILFEKCNENWGKRNVKRNAELSSVEGCFFG